MTDKITLTSLTSFNDSGVTSYNANNATIVSAIDNTLSRDGTSPNTMAADLDMNSNDIINIESMSFSANSPVSPANGQVWYDGTNLKIQLGGTTKTFTVA